MINHDVVFNEWLRRRRRSLDLTQQELARCAGCETTTVRKIEAGERRPSKELAAQLASCLDIEPEEYERFITFARSEPYPDRPELPAPAVELPGPSVVPIVPALPPPFLAQDTALEQPPPVFVAREGELAQLETALAAARSGRGQILFVIGGAGRGKTTLVQEFARRAQDADPDLIVVSGYCKAYTGLGDPYLPFREVLNLLTAEVEAKWAAGLITSANARRLWSFMPLTIPALLKQSPDLVGSFVPVESLLERASTFASPDTPWFKQLVSMAAPGHSAGLELTQTLAQYTALLKSVATRCPLLLILEDLQWVDASSNALLFHLSREVSNDPILIVGSYRPDEVAVSRGEVRHPLADILNELKRRHGDIWLDLGELAPTEGQRFVEAYLDTEPNHLDRAFREALFRHTGGHPLFTVELLREMQARGDLRREAEGYWVADAAIDWSTLPARVTGVIETRLSRLSPELQAILIVASVEGEIFTAEVVARVQQLNERSLVQQLSGALDKQHRLVTAQALDRVGPQRLSFYRFRHHLFQHYLYLSLDEQERAYLHEAIGQAMETLYGEQTQQAAVQLARHFVQAGLTEKAVSYLLQAGKQAARLSAHQEAVAHLSTGLACLEMLPATPARAEQELELQIALGNVLVAVKGHAAPEVGHIFNRARALCQKIGNTPQLLPVLHGLHRYYLVRAELPTTYELAEQSMRLAQVRQEPALLLPAHRIMGTSLWFRGELQTALTHFEQGMALYGPQDHASLVRLYGQDEGIINLCYAALALMLLGYPDQALQRSRDAITLAQTLAHPHTLAYALNYAAWPHQVRREARATQAQAEAAITLAAEQGFTLWTAMSMMHRGWALTEQGQGEEGLAQMHQGLAAWRRTGAQVGLHYFLGLLAEAHAKVSQVKEGLVAVNEAIAAVPKTGCFWEAELYRLKGELLLRKGGREARRTNEGGPEAYFLKAIKVARRQRARSLELRATVGLGRVWQQHGKKEAARRMLAKVYGRFSEGFDTLDLQEAKSLLEACSRD